MNSQRIAEAMDRENECLQNENTNLRSKLEAAEGRIEQAREALEIALYGVPHAQTERKLLARYGRETKRALAALEETSSSYDPRRRSDQPHRTCQRRGNRVGGRSSESG